MKSLLVVSQLNDPFYIDYDLEFARYIISKAKSDGLMEEDADITELDANLVMQLFSPLVLSQWLLIDQTREPSSSIVLPNGFIFAFKHTDDLLFIAVNGDGTESETFLHRKIQVLIMIIRFMFGPACEEIGQSNVYSRRGKWDFLHQLMQSWSVLVQSEQAFLVEAIERIHVNQMMNEKCMEILLKSVKMFQSSKDQPTQHALLLVNSKLLAMYSNRSAHELRPKDLLMTMIVSKTLYPYTDKLEDLFSKFYTSSKSHSDQYSLSDDTSDAGEDEYHSAPATPRDHRSQTPTSVQTSETVKNEDSFSEDALSDFNVENISLISMYKEKCPDSIFIKDNKDQADLTTSVNQADDGNQTRKNSIQSDLVVNVESGIHLGTNLNDNMSEQHASSEHASPETFNQSKSEIITGSTDYNNSNTDNFENMNSFIPNNDLTVNQSVSIETSNSETTKKSSMSENVEKIHVNGADNLIDTINPTLAHNDNEMQNKVEDTHVVSSSQSYQSNFNTNESNLTPRGKSTQEVSPANYNLQSSLPTYEENINFSVNESLVKEDTLAKSKHSFSLDLSGRSSSSQVNRSNKGKEPTVSRQQSDGSEVFSQSSSSTRSGRSGDQNNLTIKKMHLNVPTTESRPSSLLHADVPMATVPLTESSGQTPDTLASFSGFSSTTRGSGVYLPQTIFLETSTCQYSPYNFYTVQISPGLNLILLCQAQRHSLADSLYQVIQTIQDIIYGRRSKLPRSRSTNVYETINTQLGKVYNCLKKVKSRTNSLSYDVLSRWEKEELKHKLLDFLERESSFRIPPDLESPLRELYKRLRELFTLLFLSPVNSPPQLWDSLSQIKDRIRSELLDYREYLNVKAQRNITMTSYINEFPGLIHFIFIDRHFHQMTAPSLNISLKAGESMDATTYLKDKIWKMHQHMMSRLLDGYTTIMMREGDFYFSYFLWFEDHLGNPLPVQESYKPLRKQSYPGILCGQFYKELLVNCFPHAIQGSVYCNEIFMMHLGLVHPTYIAAHCRKLAYKMWEMSGEIHHSVNLL